MGEPWTLDPKPIGEPWTLNLGEPWTLDHKPQLCVPGP